MNTSTVTTTKYPYYDNITKKQLNNRISYKDSGSENNVQIFFDPAHTHLNKTSTTINTQISNYNDENVKPSNLTVDPIEQLLMSSSTNFHGYDQLEDSPIFSSDEFSIFNDFLPANYLEQQNIINSSPTFKSDNSQNFYDSNTTSPDVNSSLLLTGHFTDNESIYKMFQNSDCNSLHDYSSISNIIYTNKIKEKLRKKRYASVDLASPSPQPPSSSSSSSPSPPPVSTKLATSSRVLKPRPSSSLINSRRLKSKLRSKSADTIHLLRVDSTIKLNEDLGCKSSGNTSPNGKAINPFYQPPDILKRLSNA